MAVINLSYMQCSSCITAGKYLLKEEKRRLGLQWSSVV